VLYAEALEREERPNGSVDEKGSKTGGEVIGVGGGHIAVIACNRAVIAMARALLDIGDGAADEDTNTTVAVVPDDFVVDGVVSVTLVVVGIGSVVSTVFAAGRIVPVCVCVVGGVVAVDPTTAADEVPVALIVAMIG